METKTLQEKKVLRVPELRFREFEDEWKKKSLGSISKIITGSTPSTKIPEYFNGQRLFVSPADIGNNRFITQTKTTLTEEGFKKGRKIQKGSVLFVCIGSTIGKVALTSEECITNQQINAIEASENYKNEFIYSLLEKEGKKIKLLAGIQAVPQINKTDFSKLKFHFPSLPEQQKIASFLSVVDQKIQQLSRKKALLESYKKGVMQQLFSQEIRFKDEHGKDFPEWEVKKLGEVGNIVSGLTYSPSDICDDGVLVLRSSNVQDGKLKFNDNVYVKVDSFNPVIENDILICVRNGSKRLIGKNAIIDKKSEGLAFGAFMTVYRSKYNKFLFHFFNSTSYKKEVHKNLGATINSINGGDLKKFKVLFPNGKEQQKIANFLSALDKKTAMVSKQISQTQSFKKGLLQQLFV